MATILDDYIRKHSRSMELYKEASHAFPGGVTHDTRYMKPFPVFMDRALGPRKWDVDGNEYICYVMGHGALILGHSHPEVQAAVCAQMARGTHLGSNTEVELRWAQAVRKLMPSMEVIRFHSSGTEATMMALRLARGFTKKNKILRFADHFNGWSDYFSVGSSRNTSVGIPPEIAQTVKVIPDGDIDAVAEVLKEDTDIGGVILEPTGAGMGFLPLMPDFLAKLRDLTAERGVLLIFDEVVTGFRTSAGGAQVRFGIKPDLTALAKILAGGLPGGCIGGRSDIMELIAFHDDPEWNKAKRIAHPGTFNANPLCAAAGAKCLQIVASQPINALADAAAARLREGLNRTLKDTGVTGFSYGLASLVWVGFGASYDGDPEFCTLPREVLRKAISTPEQFKRAMLNEGIDIMHGNKFILSATHTNREIDQTIEAFGRAVRGMKREGIVG